MAEVKITLDEIKSLGRGGMKGMSIGGGAHGWKNGQDKPTPAALPATGG